MKNNNHNQKEFEDQYMKDAQETFKSILGPLIEDEMHMHENQATLFKNKLEHDSIEYAEKGKEHANRIIHALQLLKTRFGDDLQGE